MSNRKSLSFFCIPLFNSEIHSRIFFVLEKQNMSYPFLETLFHTYQSQIENKDDALIIFTHWCLISHGFQRLNGNQVFSNFNQRLKYLFHFLEN